VGADRHLAAGMPESSRAGRLPGDGGPRRAGARPPKDLEGPWTQTGLVATGMPESSRAGRSLQGRWFISRWGLGGPARPWPRSPVPCARVSVRGIPPASSSGSEAVRRSAGASRSRRLARSFSTASATRAASSGPTSSRRPTAARTSAASPPPLASRSNGVGWSGPGRVGGGGLAVGPGVAAGRTGPDRVGSRVLGRLVGTGHGSLGGAGGRVVCATGRTPWSG
jgi:hypothetical protein